MGRGRPPKCPYCGATGQSVAKGFRYNKNGAVRLRRCKACKRRWTIGPAPAKGGLHDEGVGGHESTCVQTPAKQINPNTSTELLPSDTVSQIQYDPSGEGEQTEK